MTEQLEPIEVLLPSKARVGVYQTELLWAQQEGEGLYRVYSVPFLATDIHVGDLVRCEPQKEGAPRVMDVVERSGARTIRLFFGADATDEQIREVVTLLRTVDAVIEQGNRRFWAVGLRAQEDFDSVLPHIEQLMQSGLLQFDVA